LTEEVSPEEVEIFVEAVFNCKDMPEAIRLKAREAIVVNVQARSFDESYLAFLDEQIELAPRGPEFAEKLRKRREGLREFCNIPLISGRISNGASNIWIKVEPERRAVIYWEDYENPKL
jgi:hypothetical protein